MNDNKLLESDELTQDELFLLIKSYTNDNNDDPSYIKNNQSNSDILVNDNNQIDNNLIAIDKTAETKNNTNTNKKEKKPNRCQFEDCKRKISSVDDYVCKCGLKTCRHHKFFENHNCTFNYKSEHANKLEKLNPKIVSKKMETID